MHDTIFITGMQRSGTTLLEKLIDAQPAATILSQPFPFLMVEAKRAFLEEREFPGERYPLGHLFHETRYGAGELTRFLSTYRMERERALALCIEMEGYSGQYTRFARQRVEAALVDDTFVPMLRALYTALALRRAPITGAKETTCEELLPAFLADGIRCALIIRDPRDTLASLNHGEGMQFGGRPKPTPFNIRQWRKSVAFALQLEGTAGFHWLRYEDLVADPEQSLQSLADRFALAALRHVTPVRDLNAAGATWRGNSSYGERRGISQESVGTHRGVLPAMVTRYVEAACYPEMRLLGYETTIAPHEVPAILREFREPYDTRADMREDVADEANTRLELQRFELLQRGGGESELPAFLSARAYERLSQAVRAW